MEDFRISGLFGHRGGFGLVAVPHLGGGSTVTMRVNPAGTTTFFFPPSEKQESQKTGKWTSKKQESQKTKNEKVHYSINTNYDHNTYDTDDEDPRPAKR